MSDFQNKVAIVTGGASGIGRALCQELARAGAKVVVADLDTTGAEKTASGITVSGGQASWTEVDVSRPDEVRNLIDEKTTEHDRLDYMFNNAGVGLTGELRDMGLEDWHRVVDVNLWGVIHGTQAAYQVMVRQGFGHIVNTASIAGLTPSPTQTAYSATKGAVIGLSTALRAEAADLGVRVSVVCPGFVQTEVWDSIPVLSARRTDLLAKLPTQKMAPATAARIILRDIRRNRAIITFPRRARFLWWLYRIHPALLTPMNRKIIEVFRTIRSDS